MACVLLSPLTPPPPVPGFNFTAHEVQQYRSSPTFLGICELALSLAFYAAHDETPNISCDPWESNRLAPSHICGS